MSPCIASPLRSDPYGPITLSYGHKDLKAKGELYQLGAHLEALFMDALSTVSYLGIFFCILTSGFDINFRCACKKGCFSGY